MNFQANNQLKITLYKICAVQAEGVQYRLRETLCSASPSLCCGCALACTVHPQPVLHTLSLYCTPSTSTGHSQLVLGLCLSLYWQTLSPYCIPSGCTAHPQPVLQTLRLYCTPSACTAHPQPVDQEMFSSNKR